MRLTILTLLLVALTVSGYSSEYPPRVLVELNDNTARSLWNVEQFTLETSLLGEIKLVPVFYLPSKTENLQSWYRHGLHRWFRVELSTDPYTTATSLEGVEGVTAIDLQPPMQLSHRLPNDYTNFDLWGLEKMGLPSAWDVHYGTSDILIATIDTGCDIHHEDLAANQYVNPGEDLNHNGNWDINELNGVDDDNNGFIDDFTGYDFVSVPEAELPDWLSLVSGEDVGPRDNTVYPDFYGHGTHVAGIAAGVTDNAVGIASASWNVKHLPLRVMFAYWQEEGVMNSIAYLDDAAPAIQYAVDMNVDIINMSFGDTEPRMIWEIALNYAEELDVLVLASAGNSNDDSYNYPAAYDNVIAVAALNSSDVKADFSSYGEWVSISAPGVDIGSTISFNQYHEYSYALWNGTSMSSPFVAAVAGLMLGYNPDFSRAQITAMLNASCDNVDQINPQYAGLLGYGRVNAQAALELAQLDVPSQKFENSTPQDFRIASIYPNPFNQQTRIKVELSNPAAFDLVLFDLLGREVVRLQDEGLESGFKEFTIKGKGLSSGIYIVQVHSNGRTVASEKLVLMK